MLRPLRIAVSVVSSLCCVLVIVLWVRSHWMYDELSILQSNGGFCVIVSARSQMRWGNEYFGGDSYTSWTLTSNSVNDPELLQGECLDYPTVPSYRGLILRDEYDHTYVPHWCPIVAFGALAVFPWLSHRFSLRALLLTTTVIALALGLIIYATRG
jgi:hypothetical protein